MVKSRSVRKAEMTEAEQAKLIAAVTEDRPYGAPISDKPEPEAPKADPLTKISVSLRESDSWKIQDIVDKNKRSKKGPKSISAVILEALRAQGVI
jgi:hypothetical protein